MKNRDTLSLPGVITIGVIIAMLIVGLLFGLRVINNRYRASVENAERLIIKGDFDAATLIAEKIKGNSFEKNMLKGKIYLSYSLQQQKNDEWRNYGTDSTDWLDNKFADSALLYFKNAATIDSTSATVYYQTGVLYKERGWFDKAEAAFLHAISLDSTDESTRCAIASLYTLNGEYSKAEFHLKHAYTNNHTNPEVSKGLGLLYRYHLMQPESAAIYLDRYLHNAPKGDVAIQHIIEEVEELKKRYPELPVSIPPIIIRGRQRVFIPRKQ